MDAKELLARLKKRVQQELVKCDGEMRQTDQTSRRYAWASAATECELFLVWLDEESDGLKSERVLTIKETVH